MVRLDGGAKEGNNPHGRRLSRDMQCQQAGEKEEKKLFVHGVIFLPPPRR
jgi:hypothetical protein